MENEPIDLKNMNQRDLVITLIQEMKEVRRQVDKYVERDSKELRGKVEELNIKMAVIYAKAAAYGSIGGIGFSALTSFIIKIISG